jgi:hypothetical protein
MNFWSADLEELNGIAEELGVTMKVNAKPLSSEQWLAATDGLATVQESSRERGKNRQFRESARRP